MMELARAGCLALSLALLAGCVGGDSPPPPALCPKVGIIDGLQSLERPTAPGSAELGYYAALENVDGACRPEQGDLVVEMAIDLVVRPGASVSGTTLDLPYFVAISRPDGTVIDRQDFVGRVSVPTGARRAGITETFSQRFVGLAQGAAGYQVMFGFALPEDEALRQRQGG
jgi:hypothetical protein